MFYNIKNLNTKPNISKQKAIETAVNEFGASKHKIEDETSLIIYPQFSQEIEYKLCWKVRLSTNNPIKTYTFFISAIDGDIVYSQNEMIESINVTGNTKGGYWPQHYYDTPVTSVPFITNVKLYSTSMNLDAETYSNDNGYYFFDVSTGQRTLVFNLQDQYCKIINFEAPTSPVIHEKRIIYPIAGSPTPVYENKEWGLSDFTNAKWHVRKVHDFYKYNFNFSESDYCMEVHINAGANINGQADGNKLYFGTKGGYQWVRTSDIIYHEYTHNVIYKLYNGWIGTSENDEAGAMNEGLPDYFACSINNDAVYGESVDPGNERSLINTLSFDPSRGSHGNGRVISGACWEIRQAVGATIADNLIFKTLQMSPKARSFQNFLNNMIVINKNYYNDTYYNQIVNAFSNHSILPSQTHVIRVPEDFSTISSAVFSAVPGKTVIVSGNQSLNGNINIPSGVTLKFLNGSTLNFNNFGIFSGTISIDNGANIDGVYFGGGFYHVQTAINNASSGQIVNLLNRTYNTNINMKSNVIVNGAGVNNTTINGNIIYDGDYSSKLKYVTVLGNIQNWYGRNNEIEYVNVIGNISIGNDNNSLFKNFNMVSSTNNSLTVGYSYSHIRNGNIRNKINAGIIGDHCDLTLELSTLCNNIIDVRSLAVSDEINFQNCSFSGLYAGERMEGLGSISWNVWSYCNSLQKDIDNDAANQDSELQSDLVKLDKEKTFIGKDEYKAVMESYNRFLAEIREENNDKIIDYRMYKNGLDEILTQFKKIIELYPGTVSALKSIQISTGIYHLLQNHRDARKLLNELLLDRKNAEIKSNLKIILLPLFIDEKNYNSAIELCDEILKEIPKSLEASFVLFNKGKIYEIFINDDKSAKVIYNQLIEQYPGSIYSNLACEYLGKEPVYQNNGTLEKTEFSSSNYPNPFNPSTTIRFNIPQDGKVEIRVYDILGREIAVLLNEYMQIGSHSVHWSGKNSFGNEAASGIYFYNIRFNDQSITKKMMLIR